MVFRCLYMISYHHWLPPPPPFYHTILISSEAYSPNFQMRSEVPFRAEQVLGGLGRLPLKSSYLTCTRFKNLHFTIPRDPITLSKDDWDVQSPPQQSI